MAGAGHSAATTASGWAADTGSRAQRERRRTRRGAARGAPRARDTPAAPRAARVGLLTEAGAACAQPLELGWRTLAPECAVAVGETPEPLDDRAVVLGRAQGGGEGLAQLHGSFGEQPPGRRNRFLLHLAALGVLQRHVEEDPLHNRERCVRRGLHAREREAERLLIVGKGTRGAAEDAARELIEQDDEAQPPPWPIGPPGQFAPRSALEQLTEAGADMLISPLTPRGSFVPEPEKNAAVQGLRGQRHGAEPEIAHAACLIHAAVSLRSAPRRPRTSARAAARLRGWWRGTSPRPP